MFPKIAGYIFFSWDPFALGCYRPSQRIRALKMSPAAQLRFPWTPLMPNEVAKEVSLAGSQQGNVCKAKT